MPSTRQRILLFLDLYQPASISDIGAALGLTSPDILYHIQALLKSGQIELFQSGIKLPARPGRPVKKYRLKRVEIPNNYAHLASSLLGVFLSQFNSEEEKKSGLKMLAQKLFIVDPSPKPLKTRVNQLVNLLSAHNYAARWEAHHLGPQIIFANCPYQALLPFCPELCALDGYILENHLNAPATLLQYILDDGKSPRVCRFMIETEA
jgi:predicted ArsR family transcriptional regulator